MLEMLVSSSSPGMMMIDWVCQSEEQVCLHCSVLETEVLEDMIDWRQEQVEDMAGDSRDEEEDKASFHTKEEEDCEDTCSMDELLAVVVAAVAVAVVVALTAAVVVVALTVAVVAAEAGKCKKVLSEETELLVVVVELLLGEVLAVFDTDQEHSSQCQECSHCSSLLAGSG